MEDRTRKHARIAEFDCKNARLRWGRSGGAAECAREHLERKQDNAAGMGPAALDDKPRMAVTAF